MDKLIILSLLTLILIIPNPGKAVVIPEQESISNKSITSLSAIDLIKLDQKEIEEKIGRKLKLKEKIALKIIKRKLKKQASKTPNETSTNSVVIVGFSLSLASLLLSLLFLFTSLGTLLLLSIICGILGIIFSSIALKRINRQSTSRNGKGLAVTGLVTGIVVVGAWLILLLAFIIAYGLG